MSHEPFLSETNASRRRAVFEDNGVAAYVYLLAATFGATLDDGSQRSSLRSSQREHFR